MKKSTLAIMLSASLVLSGASAVSAATPVKACVQAEKLKVTKVRNAVVKACKSEVELAKKAERLARSVCLIKKPLLHGKKL